MENENDTEKAAPPPLPLGWTQVRRRPRANNDDNNNAADEIDWCCDDPNCKRTSRDSDAVKPAPENAITVKGNAVFCLPEMDPEWFQGYLQIEGQRKPWGLLAMQETLDECLECKDGGYRQITLKVLTYNNSKEPYEMEHVEWTGGDMMRLKSGDGVVSMETDCLWTGKKAVPYVEKYFGSLVDKLRENADDSVLEVLPELAIVTGPMTLQLPVAVDESTESVDRKNA